MRKPRSFAGNGRFAIQSGPYESASAEIGQRARALVRDRLTVSFSWDHELFLQRIECLAASVAFWGARINITAVPEDPREICFHIVDSLAPVSLAADDPSLRHAFAAGNRILDLGSGAGFPGLVLASASPAHYTLVESRRKRASFLIIAAADMGLTNVVVESKRIMPGRPKPSHPADDGLAKRCFDVVTGRAFTAPSAFHSAASSALKPDGIAILYANPAQDLSLATAHENGLIEFHSIAYTVPRNQRSIERILAVWRRQ